jgi:endonuclease YncB( thermonuclease family)
MRHLIWTALTLVLFLSFGAEANEVTGKVVGVHDGDSLTLLISGNRELKVRLEGIDAPELKQAFGNASKKSLSDLIFGRSVVVAVTGVDRYKRTLGHVVVGDVWVNLAQVEKGLAWHYKKYSSDLRLSEAELRARSGRLGLWREDSPIPPWEWRSAKKREAAPEGAAMRGGQAAGISDSFGSASAIQRSASAIASASFAKWEWLKLLVCFQSSPAR